MSSGKLWTYDELLIAMNLYCKLPFGQLHRGNPMIIEISRKMGRTPSTLAMKLCNLAAFDPYHKARGVKGLSSTSKGDQEIWAAFHADWEGLSLASEKPLQQLLEDPENSDEENEKDLKNYRRSPQLNRTYSVPPASTEKVLQTKVRIGQNFFRQSVLASYNSRCCVTGNPVPELLVASHILPWKSHP